MTEHTITIKASQLRDLFEPVLPFADKGDSLPVLRCINVRAQGDSLYALATDRYRIAMQRIRLSDAPPEGLAFLIDTRSVRGILSLYKVTRASDPEITLTFAADRVTVTGAGSLGFLDSSTAWTLEQHEYPKVSQVFLRAATTATEGTAGAALNTEYLADFRHAVPRRLSAGVPMRIWTQANGPALIKIGDDFIGAQMAVRPTDDSPLTPELDEGWTAALAATNPAEKEAAA